LTRRVFFTRTGFHFARKRYGLIPRDDLAFAAMHDRRGRQFAGPAAQQA
jgi:hypothetical protein